MNFTFRVHFENLSDRELGALCWTLHPLGEPQKDYCHHIGMGKPLGMGAVKLEAILRLTNRSTRYASLFNGSAWETGAMQPGDRLADGATLERLIRAFEQHILSESMPTNPCAHLSNLKRIAMLLKMLEWPGFPPILPPIPNNRVVVENGRKRPNTRYMMIELPGVQGSQRNEYRTRPVLPDPSVFGDLTGNTEPNTIASESAQSSTDVQSPSTSVKLGSHSSSTEAESEPESVRAITTREFVTLLEDAKRSKAQVQTEDGQVIVCTDLSSYPIAKSGMRCRADVTRQGGKAQSAIFKGWK